jgi:hypothetical protein
MVLKILSRRPRLRGYAIMTAIQDTSDDDMSDDVLSVGEGTLYPALHRMEEARSLWSRIGYVFRGERLYRETDDELQPHADEAIAHGRDPDEARRAFGSAIRTREQCREIKLWPWLDSVRADAVFGGRQILGNKTGSVAAILSLGLAVGEARPLSAGLIEGFGEPDLLRLRRREERCRFERH